jgi:hypothetical protein
MPRTKIHFGGLLSASKDQESTVHMWLDVNKVFKTLLFAITIIAQFLYCPPPQAC